MKDLFLSYGIKIDKKAEERFLSYYDLLVFYNEKFNITAIIEKKDVYIKHFIDSALGEKFINGDKLIDIGTGGGFPSLPLKILRPELKVTLMDATLKKCEFLKTVIKELKLDNCEVICGRAEEYAFDSNFREKYDFAVARAVARLNILCEYVMPFVKVNGEFIAYKGDAEDEIKEAENAVKTLGGKVDKVEKFSLSGAERTFVIIKKERNTPDIFPRKNGVIRKRPL